MRTRWWHWALMGAGVLFVVLGVYVFSAYLMPKVGTPTAEVVKDTPSMPEPQTLAANTLFVGDVYWGRYVNDWSMKSDLKMAYPFSRLNEFHRESYDAWIGNLECPTVAGFTQTSAQEDTTLSFNCSPDYLPEAAKWFDAMSLANNHTDNRGAAGFTETKQQLDAHSIQYFGHYDPAVTEDSCEVVSLSVTVVYDDQSKHPHKLPVAMCGYNGVFKIPPAAAIEEIQKYAAFMPVIVMPHMGAEYQTAPDALRMRTYRAMIDAGADMVLGNHPHWVQSTESYKGRLIVYSMGNFIFDQQANKEVTRSAAIQVALSSSASDSDSLQAWLKLGDTCANFKDTCLHQASEQGLKKLPIQYRYGALGASSAQKITKPATETETEQILQRLQWSQTMNQLQTPYGSL